jgi:hypothetical protein
VRATAGADRFIHGGWKSVEEEALWESFAPIVHSDDPNAYHWVETDKTYPATHKKAGQTIMARQLRPGARAAVTERLDPKKDGWRKMPDVMLKKCAEAAALRRGWPEDLSGLYVEEELDRSQVIDADYTDLTPSEMVERINSEDRLARIGGPALFATFDEAGTLERIPFGKFADRMLEATAKLEPAAVAALVERNREALREFWAHSANDALELRKILETRSGVTNGAAPQGDTTRATAAAPPIEGERDTGAAAQHARAAKASAPKLQGLLAERHRDNLIRQIGTLDTPNDLLSWARDGDAEIGRLPEPMAEKVRAEFNSRQNIVKGMHR